jgi:stringent starvation protein B
MSHSPDSEQGGGGAEVGAGSTRPYLLRALHEWCTDNGFTPYVAVHVDASVRVPAEYVKNSEIVLNVSFSATSGLKLGNEAIEFKARFGGVVRDIMVPVDHVVAIYARENGQGMAFPMPVGESAAAAPGDGAETAARGPRLAPVEEAETPSHQGEPESPTPSPGPPRPSLKRIK